MVLVYLTEPWALNLDKDKDKQKQTGTDALDAMTAAKDGQEKLINIFENPSPAVTQESKLSVLDKLILEVLKENTWQITQKRL